jgi:sodium transport system permease protein
MPSSQADNQVERALPAGGALARVGRLGRKELSEILRDRRTVVTLVAMPLLLYPVLSITFQQFFLASKLNPTRGPEYRLGFTSQVAADVLAARLRLGESVLEAQAARRGKQTAGKPDAPRFRFHVGSLETLDEALRNGDVDLMLRLADKQAPPRAKRDWEVQIEAVYVPDSAGALGALSYIERRLAAANELDLRRRLNVPGVPPTMVISLERTPLAEPGRDSLVSLPALVPLILILMTITGAVYPAIDLTAGERERGTLETLIAAPVPRFALLCAKYIAVVTVAVLTASVNVVAMALTLMLSGLGPLVFPDGVSPAMLVVLFGLLVLFAAFFSAVLLCLTSFARSFKEAQAYLIPLMLASLAPGIIAMLPGLQLDLLLAAVPLLNVVLLARDLMSGQAEPLLALVIGATTLVYAVAALSLAARVFGSENVLYSEQSGWSDLFRRPEESQPCADVTTALWCLALVIPLHFALRSSLPLVHQLGSAAVLLLLTAGSVLLFGALPALAAYLSHVDWHSGFRLAAPRPLALAAGLVLGCSLWPPVIELLALARHLVPEFVEEQASAAVRSMRAAGLLAVVPFVAAAAGEELFFRGFLFQALRRVTSPAATVIVTTLLFGLTHAALGGALGLGQLAPSLVLGLVLGIVCWASGSVWPGMVLHVCHNTVMVLIAQGGLISTSAVDAPVGAASAVGLAVAPGAAAALPAVAALLTAPAIESVPRGWVLAGLAGCGLGLLLLWLGRRGDDNPCVRESVA